MLRYVVSNERFYTFFSKYTSRLRRLLSLFKWGPLSPPNSLYIPWGLASSRGGQRMVSASSAGPDTMTNTGQGSSVSMAFALLPLVPTLFVSGMHFFAAARAQWVVHHIQKENRTQTQFLRRLSVVSIFLSIREQRLTWLAQRIREFEDAELEKQDDEEYEDVSEDINENDDGGDENNTGNGSEQTDRDRRPVVMTGIPSEGPVRPRYLAHDAHSHVYSMLQGERSNEWPHDQFQSLDNINSSNNGQNGTVPNHRPHPSIDVRLFPLAFGPDLKNMDLTLFLNSPQERKRILRLEFEGMRDELTAFRDTTVRSRY
ncbi:hypothetical protein BGX21_003439 [Mortierella sp. AD011]|nr:hypothetical protein BGX20_000874 [Mortierella sp. AD010]KAF9376577.1 hypothetical protein BGX21_003439 [Mortierella sp. AD011]